MLMEKPEDLEGKTIPPEGGAAPEKPGEKVVIDEKYAGKKIEELIPILKQYEEQVGRHAQELGELKKRVAYADEERRRREYEEQLRALSSQQARGQQVFEGPQYKDEDFDYSKPYSSVIPAIRDEIRRELGTRDASRAKYEQQMYIEYAKKNYETGKRGATRDNPELYAGIESDIDGVMIQSFVSGKFTAEDLADERIWEKTAQLIRLDKGDFDQLRHTRKIEPIQAGGGGNLPSQVREQPSELGINFQKDEKTESIMRAFGLTEEKAKENIKAERERGGA